jgi:hypothetical protein
VGIVYHPPSADWPVNDTLLVCLTSIEYQFPNSGTTLLKVWRIKNAFNLNKY